MKRNDVRRFLLSFLYPNQCPFCDKIIHHAYYACDECTEKLLPPPTASFSHISQFFAACAYDDFVKHAVYSMKNNNNGYAAECFAYYISRILEDEGIAEKVDFITFVPTSREKLFQRGYNPAELLAEEISRLTRLEVRKDLLLANESESEQKQLSAAERSLNVRKIFHFSQKAKLSGEKILLIDDICTTGSTVDYLAELLFENGAGEVFAAVFAKTKNLE